MNETLGKNKSFAIKLSELRQLNGVTLEKMSYDLGFSISSIHAWEKATRRPKSWETIQLIAQYFGVPYNYFYDCDIQETQGVLSIHNLLRRLENLENKVSKITRMEEKNE